MELTVLGCGDAFGNDGRNNSSYLITSGDERILLDCGASTLIRLKHEKIDLESISTIIISHFHGDHFGGIPFFLISSLYEKPRENSLTIVGPEGVKNRVYELQEAMYADTSKDIKEKLDLKFEEYKEGSTIQLADKSISAFRADHSPGSIPHSIRLDWMDKSIAYSGDTSWTEGLVPLSKGTDIFICECNFLDKVSFGHLSYSEILEKKHLFETGQLWLAHMANEVINENDFKLNRLFDGQKILF